MPTRTLAEDMMELLGGPDMAAGCMASALDLVDDPTDEMAQEWLLEQDVDLEALMELLEEASVQTLVPGLSPLEEGDSFAFILMDGSVCGGWTDTEGEGMAKCWPSLQEMETDLR